MDKPKLDALHWPELSSRQREVLELVLAGQSNKQIGRTLNISNRTVEAHRRSALDKLRCHGTASLFHEYFDRTGHLWTAREAIETDHDQTPA